MIIGTAGHIDHGKTTLVKALTGVDCDRLKEEKERGITVDLGYAYTPCSGGTDKGESTLGFVDVPGHEKLVHNMLAGVTGIDFALLVVAADDGPMPQTREHLEIIELLSIPQGAVALSKIDVVDTARLAEVQQEIRALLAGTTLATAPIFPVDATTATGTAVLRAHLEQIAQTRDKRGDEGHFRLAVDRCFTLSGIGTVVTGTAFSGRVTEHKHLVVSPSSKAARVRSLRVQDRPARSGQAGERIALALSGIEKSEIARGMWVLAPELNHPQNRFSATLRVLPGQPPLKHWTQVHCHLGADDIPGRVALLEGDEVLPGESGLAEIILQREISVIAGDRLILRDAAARQTLGGGQVLDIFPPARRKRSPERLAVLRALASGTPTDALILATEQHASGVDLTRYAAGRNLTPEALQRLVIELNLKRVGGDAFASARWQELGERLITALAEEHLRNPDMPGVERDRLRRLTLPALSRPAFDALLSEQLAAAHAVLTGAWVHLPEHRLQLGAKDHLLWQTVKPLLDAAPYNPPRVREVAQSTGMDENTLRNALKRIARIGEAYPVAHDHYFTATAVDDLARRVAGLCQREGKARAASLRDEIGGGRKVAIHILEFFDRIGYTRRVRDTHVLRRLPEEGPRMFT